MQLRGVIPFIGIVLWLQRIGAYLLPQRYSFMDIPLSWYEAQRFCRVKFTDLVTINNMYNNNKLLDALGGQVSLTWIGLHRGASDRWMWADGGGEALFTRWTEGEPNQLAADEWCAEASSSGRWNDVSCAEKKDFICYDRRDNGKHEFTFYSEKSSWEDSLEWCRKRHTNMASVRTDEENLKIVDMIKTWTGFFGVHNEAWIGLFRDAWMWSDGGKTSFRFWLRGATSGGNCASIAGNQQGRWVALNCNQKATFFCQGDLKKKKMVIKMKLNSDVDPSDSKTSDILLKKLETNLRLQQMTDFKLGWRSEKRGLVFQRYEEQEVAQKKGC
uniref:C-type lectin domain-containing protein n=1 Tax=Amphiprion ocellaris TaxID=80972 RepID=A0AAQ5X0I9_AMPOC